MKDILSAALEIKSLGDAASGEFSGYGAVFYNTDHAGDRILPGAFTETLAERKAMGRTVPMHLNHGLPGLGGQRGIGVWKAIAEDERGLRVEGKISGMNTDAGRLLYERVRDGAIGGLSIGFQVKGNGAAYGRNPGEPRRTIKSATLGEISIVDDPCNSLALVDSIKSARLDSEDFAVLDALAEVKSRLAAGDTLTEREWGRLLRDVLGLSRSQSEDAVNFGFKAGARESKGKTTDNPEVKAARADLRAMLDGFTLPTFGRD